MKNSITQTRMLVCGLALGGLVLAACDGSTGPTSQLSELEPAEVSASEELVSQAMVDEAASLSDRADFMTDVANRDRVCRISERTVAAGEVMLEKADALSAYLLANYAQTASSHVAPGFAQAAEELLAGLIGPTSCRRVVHRLIALSRAGHALGAALHREGLLRRDDRLPKLVREAREQFRLLLQLVRQDLATQARDRRVTDRP